MADGKRACVLTIAGLDSSGGAGIIADAEAIGSLGLSVAVACTAVTAQTSAGVRHIFPIPAASVAAQLEAAFEQHDVRAVKTGMLAQGEIVRLVAAFLRGRPAVRLVVDPVMHATAGGALLSEEGIAALMEELLPLAYVVTPNLPEAARLAGMPVANVVQMRDAARKIRSLGAQNVIVTGGHLADRAVDVVYDGSRFDELPGRKLPAKVHGTGCTYSAALAAYLALASPLHKAAAGAKLMATRRIELESAPAQPAT